MLVTSTTNIISQTRELVIRTKHILPAVAIFMRKCYVCVIGEKVVVMVQYNKTPSNIHTVVYNWKSQNTLNSKKPIKYICTLPQ